MDETDKPQMPEPEKKSTGDIPPAAENGTGDIPHNPVLPPQVDTEKLILWMQATDKQIKMLTVGQIILCAAVIGVIFISAKVQPPAVKPVP